VSDLLGRDRYVFNQKMKVIELNTEFAIRDEEGNEIGMVRQEGQSTLKKALRLVSSLDQFMTHKLAVYDATGSKVVELTRPAKVFKSTVVVNDGQGGAVGKIVQKNMIGKIKFALEDAQGQPLGVGLLDPGRLGGRGRAHHEEVGGDPEGGVHRRRQLPPRGQGSGVDAYASGDARLCRGHRPRAQAGRPRPRLSPRGAGKAPG